MTIKEENDSTSEDNRHFTKIYCVMAKTNVQQNNTRVIGKHKKFPKVKFLIRCYLPLKKLMVAYCKHNKLDQKHFVFKFDGELIRGTETPLSLYMDDGDTITVHRRQPRSN